MRLVFLYRFLYVCWGSNGLIQKTKNMHQLNSTGINLVFAVGPFLALPHKMNWLEYLYLDYFASQHESKIICGKTFSKVLEVLSLSEYSQNFSSTCIFRFISGPRLAGHIFVLKFCLQAYFSIFFQDHSGEGLENIRNK